MKNSYPQNKPLFGRRMSDVQSEDAENSTHSSLSEDKARLLLLEKEREEAEKRQLQEAEIREAEAKATEERERRKQELLREKEEKHARRAQKQKKSASPAENEDKKPSLDVEKPSDENEKTEKASVRSFHFGAPIEKKAQEAPTEDAFSDAIKEKYKKEH